MGLFRRAVDSAAKIERHLWIPRSQAFVFNGVTHIYSSSGLGLGLGPRRTPIVIYGFRGSQFKVPSQVAGILTYWHRLDDPGLPAYFAHQRSGLSGKVLQLEVVDHAAGVAHWRSIFIEYATLPAIATALYALASGQIAPDQTRAFQDQSQAKDDELRAFIENGGLWRALHPQARDD